MQSKDLGWWKGIWGLVRGGGEEKNNAEVEGNDSHPEGAHSEKVVEEQSWGERGVERSSDGEWSSGGKQSGKFMSQV